MGDSVRPPQPGASMKLDALRATLLEPSTITKPSAAGHAPVHMTFQVPDLRASKEIISFMRERISVGGRAIITLNNTKTAAFEGGCNAHINLFVSKLHADDWIVESNTHQQGSAQWILLCRRIKGEP